MFCPALTEVVNACMISSSYDDVFIYLISPLYCCSRIVAGLATCLNNLLLTKENYVTNLKKIVNENIETSVITEKALNIE
jgi:hypothetical protein